MNELWSYYQVRKISFHIWFYFFGNITQEKEKGSEKEKDEDSSVEKDKSEKKDAEESKKETEPATELLDNPSRVMQAQVSFCLNV